MKVSILFLDFLVLGSSGVLAGNEIRKRDLQTIQNAFVNIQTTSSTLNGVIMGVNSDPQSAMAIMPAAQAVEQALAQARDDVGSTQPITLADEPQLQSTALGLSSTVKITVMSMMLNKPMLDQVGATPMVLQTLNNQKMLAGMLGQQVFTKLPAEGIPGAQMAFGGAAGSIDVGIAMLGMSGPLPGVPVPGMPPGPPGGMATAPGGDDAAGRPTNGSATTATAHQQRVRRFWKS